jgi:hypothetical protein
MLATGTTMEIALKSAPLLSPEPLGDMTLAPIMMTGRTEAELARAMAEHLRAARPGSGAEALRTLRTVFPNSPLTLRVTALAALMRR